MKRAVPFLGFILVVLFAQPAWPQAASPDITGTVASVDTSSNVIALDDGRRVQVVPGAVVLIAGRPSTLSALTPGTRVVIRQGQLLGAAPGASTAASDTVTIQVPASRMTVQIPRQTVVVEQQPPQITVQQQSPDVVMRAAPAPQVMMQGQSSTAPSALPREAVRPPARDQSQVQAPLTQQPSGARPAMPPQGVTMQGDTTTVRAPQSQVTVQVPRSRVIVEQQPPQIIVQQQPPEVVVQPAPPPQVQVVPSTETPAASPRTK